MKRTIVISIVLLAVLAVEASAEPADVFAITTDEWSGWTPNGQVHFLEGYMVGITAGIMLMRSPGVNYKSFYPSGFTTFELQKLLNARLKTDQFPTLFALIQYVIHSVKGGTLETPTALHR